MAFEVFLFRFVDGDVASLDRDRVGQILARYGASASADHVALELPDGPTVEVDLEGSSPGEYAQVGLTFRSVSSMLYGLIHELLGTNLVALVVDQPSVPLLRSAEQALDLPAGEFAEPVVCSCWQDVEAAINPPFRKWVEWF